MSGQPPGCGTPHLEMGTGINLLLDQLIVTHPGLCLFDRQQIPNLSAAAAPTLLSIVWSMSYAPGNPNHPNTNPTVSPYTPAGSYSTPAVGSSPNTLSTGVGVHNSSTPSPRGQLLTHWCISYHMQGMCLQAPPLHTKVGEKYPLQQFNSDMVGATVTCLRCAPWPTSLLHLLLLHLPL